MASDLRKTSTWLYKVKADLLQWIAETHEQQELEIPSAWAIELVEAAHRLGQIAAVYKNGRPVLPPDPAWFNTTYRDYLTDWIRRDDIPF